MYLIVTLEDNRIIRLQIKEKVISKNELFSNYLNDIFDVSDWYVECDGNKVSSRNIYDYEDIIDEQIDNTEE